MSKINPGKEGLLKGALIAGLVVATLIAAGTTLNYMVSGGKDPVRLLHFVASGIFGSDAFASETHNRWNMAMFGLLFHVLISTGWVYGYFMLHNRSNILSKHWWISGIVYGLVIWFAMAIIVMPLSNAPAVPIKLKGALVDMLIIVLCAGLPVSLMAKKYSDRVPILN